MRRVAALRGVRFQPARVGSLEGVIAPPYDVVTRRHIQEYMERNPYNVIQLDVGLASTQDLRLGSWDEVGTRFRQWLDAGVLAVDPDPAVYVVRHRYRLMDGSDHVLTFALVGLRAGQGPERAALPHERTVAAVREDRIRQLRRCRAHFSPILALVSDPQLAIQRALEAACQAPPGATAAAPDGGQIELWVHPAETGPGRAVMDALAAGVDAHPAIIADGHHRYEAACELAAQEAKGNGVAEEAGSRWVLAGLASLEGGGLSILPVHRIVGPPGASTVERLRLALYDHFLTLSPAELPPSVRERQKEMVADPIQAARAVAEIRRHLGRPVAGVVWGPQAIEWMAVPAKAVWRGNASAPDYSGAAADVAMLHQGPLAAWRPAVDGDGAAPGGARDQHWIRYTPDPREAVRMVIEGAAAASILVAPIHLGDVRDAAAAGRRMPEKSTYFYPKLTSGLVIQDLDLPVQPWAPPGR
ncbi:MAG: DUF1015 domain-containing protein [Limnochordaceae bacterium]|nr:DUF1015 domain-containing protein [Limnochordaceae bacterium]